MLQQVYKEHILSRSIVFLWRKSELVEDDFRCGTISAPSLAQSLLIPRSSVIICQMLLRFNPRSSEINRIVNRRSPSTIFFTSLTLVIFLVVEDFPHLESSSTSSRPSMNLLYQRKTVEQNKVCSL